MKKISPSQLLEAKYRNLQSGAFMQTDDKSVILSDSIVSRSPMTNFLYGSFIRLASPIDIASTKPGTLASLTADMLKKIGAQTNPDFGFAVVQTDQTISNIQQRVRYKYEEVIMMAVLAICEMNLTEISINGEFVSVDPIFNDLTYQLTDAIRENPDYAGIYMEKFLKKIKELSLSHEPEIEQVAEVLLTVFRDLILNFCLSFAPAFEQDWDLTDLSYTSRYAGLTPKAFVTKFFFDLEKCYAHFMIRKLTDPKLSFYNESEKLYVNSEIICFLESIQPVKVDKRFLMVVEATFLELVTPIIFKHAVLPTVKTDTYLDRLRDIKVYFSYQSFLEVQEFIENETYLPENVARDFVNKVITDPQKIGSRTKKKKKKKFSQSADTSSQKSSVSQTRTPVQSTKIEDSQLDIVTFNQLTPKVRVSDIFAIQNLYLEKLYQIQQRLVQRQTLTNLLGSIQECLDNQEQIASHEVLEWYHSSHIKANKVDANFQPPLDLVVEFTDLLDDFDLSNLTVDVKSSAQALELKVSQEYKDLGHEISLLNQEITSSLKTLESVIRRIFKGTLDTIDELDLSIEVSDVEDVDTSDSADLEYIKTAFNGSNPRFKSKEKVEEFVKLLGMRVGTGGKHLAMFRGDTKICTLALTTIQEDRLYMKAVVKQLFEDHGIDKDLLHRAITEFLN